MVDDEARIELLRTHDPTRAQMIRELLEAEGIPVSTPGLEHRAMLGVIGGYVEVVVQVPRRDLLRAQELLEALDAAPLEGHEVDDDEPREDRAAVGYRDPARARSTVHGKRRRVAVAASLMIPGGGHLYVAQWRSAAIIALTEVIALVSIGFGVPYVGLILPMAVLADALGGAWHCERLAGRERPSWRRFAPELVAALLVGWVALLIGPGAEWAAGPRSTLWCTRVAECDGIDRRQCLWDAAARSSEAVITRGCETCLARSSCEDLDLCDECFQ